MQSLYQTLHVSIQVMACVMVLQQSTNVFSNIFIGILGQCPLGRVSLVTAYKDGNLQHNNQAVGGALASGQLIWNTQKSTTSTYCPVTSSQSPGCRCKEDWLAHIHRDADARKSNQFAVTRLLTQGRPAGSQSPGCWRKEDQWVSPLRPCIALNCNSYRIQAK